MCHDVSSDWLFWVNCVGHATPRVSSHLISQEHGNIELFGNLLKATHHAVEHLLPFGQLAPARVVHAERCHDRVNDEQRKLVLNHLGGCLHQELNERVDCEGSADQNVVQHLFGVQVEALGDGFNAFGSERVFRVDEQHFALATSLCAGQLCCH